MNTRIWLIMMVALSGAFLLRPSVAPVNADEEHIEREVHELEERIEAALDAGRLEEARDLGHELSKLLRKLRAHDDDDEHEDERWEEHELEFELHVRELEVRRGEIEVEMAEMERRMEAVELLSNPIVTALDGIDMAGEVLEPEEAAKFFAELVTEAEHFPVKQRLRQRLVHLYIEMDQREQAIDQLRSLILATDD